ncbi:MAG: hypothetical protein M3N31_07510 [Actinomycetota bacterium]|nr:hypothetical protein [Actinomycetota bacterium]
MSLFGDDHYEMRTQPLLDEQTIESILAGRSPSGQPEVDELARFVNEVRSVSSGPSPVVGTQLAAVLAGGLTTDKGDLPVTAASNVTGLAEQAAGLPKRRKSMLETIFAKAALAKAAAVLGGLSIATTGAAAAGVLPGAAQNGVAAVIEALSPFDLPDSDDKRRDAEHRNDDVADDRPEVPAPQADRNAHDNFGATVSGRAPEEPQQDGRAFGESVSNSAPKAGTATDAQTRRPAASQPASTPTASNNPGTSYRESAPAQQPSQTPTADSNPGTSYRR